jgi:hypothetical protein
MRHRAGAVRIALPIAVVVAVSLIVSVATGAIPGGGGLEKASER